MAGPRFIGMTPQGPQYAWDDGSLFVDPWQAPDQTAFVDPTSGMPGGGAPPVPPPEEVTFSLEETTSVAPQPIVNPWDRPVPFGPTPGAVAPSPPPAVPRAPTGAYGVPMARPSAAAPKAEQPAAELPATVESPERRAAEDIAAEQQLDPLLVAQRGAELEHGRQLDAARKHQKALEDDLQAQKDAQARYEAAEKEAKAYQAKVVAEADAVAKTTKDPNRWWRSRSTGQKISAAFGIALGGLMRPLQGRNSALDIIQGAIEQDLQSQAEDLANQRAAVGQKQGIVAQLFASNANMKQSLDAARIASLKLVQQKIENEKALYDPAGTQAQMLDELAVDAQARIVAAEAAAGKERFERSLKIAEAEDRRARVIEEGRHNRATEGLQRGQLSISAMKAAAEAQDADAGEVIENTGDGRGPSRIKNPTERQKFREIKIGAEQYIRKQKELRDLVNAQGDSKAWTSWLETPEGEARFRALAGDIVVSYALSKGQGALGNEERVKLTEQLVGDLRLLGSDNIKARATQNIKSAEKDYVTAARAYIPGYKLQPNLTYDPETGDWVSYKDRPKDAKQYFGGQAIDPRTNYPISDEPIDPALQDLVQRADEKRRNAATRGGR